ncbi:MAG: hypothetical protein AAF192_16910 [Pseudomonadota bacterium]
MPRLPLVFAAVWLGLAAPAALGDELADAFAAADVNGDGHLDVDEYVAAVVVRFAEHDANGDGVLTSAELPEADADAFAMADRDGSGTLSLGEAVADRMIRFFDAGGEDAPHGVVTLEELRAYIEQRNG